MMSPHTRLPCLWSVQPPRPLGDGAGEGTPYIVTELMGGGDVEGMIEKAPEHRPPLERTLTIGVEVCRGIEFAHEHGIVHRDLKPGNVWLTADLTPGSFVTGAAPAPGPSPSATLRPAGEGETAIPSPRGGGLGRGQGGGEGVAKLGDFGLAVALDRSRLTQAGMMVGTVSYMPPEQAMGGEVTPRSDLYSLGAMLYEMVTGRPPFVGDDSVAVITQHLNAQPVIPSWHNAEMPAALEALILRLLDKDPDSRPASADEVRLALESVRAGLRPARSGQAPETRAPAANPMYRRAFVGRESELRQLQAAYDAAVSGQSALAMVVGEPGIGKTSLCEQVATYATIRGGKTLVGHCYEEGSLSLPYLPFVEAMRSYVLARDPDGLRRDLGSGAGEVARIVSEIRDRLQVELPASGAPDDDRWRLLQATGGFLRNAAAVQPLVLVLEDLHDADRGTLDLLLHLSRNLGAARLLIVGTYRDVEVDRAHPLSASWRSSDEPRISCAFRCAVSRQRKCSE
jgi:eukaryotic-like serine/threonine-protein kinase